MSTVDNEIVQINASIVDLFAVVQIIQREIGDMKVAINEMVSGFEDAVDAINRIDTFTQKFSNVSAEKIINIADTVDYLDARLLMIEKHGCSLHGQ